MSLSPQRNRLRKPPDILECASCGEMRMKLKTGTLPTPDGIRLRNARRWVCEVCGEELMDKQTVAQIRRARHGSRAAA